jgi:epoxyqueuosine reductase
LNSREKNTAFIKNLAARHGFDYCGIAAAGYMEDDARRLESWLSQGMQGKMAYMENHFDKRVDPSKLVPGAKSVITVLKNYFPEEKPVAEKLISKYAWGKDYHTVIRGRLRTMMEEMQGEIGDFQGRGFVDSAPVLERSWAGKSGLGWIGKNGNLINKSSGSFFFIATLITDLDLVYDDPFAKDYCGSCTRCIDACPTDAILPGKTINGSKCISYFTIELKDEIPEEMKGKFGNWMFGCDICQDVCPWNRFSKPHSEPEFTPYPEILNFSNNDWEELSEETFKKVFRDSPLSRAKFKGISRNLKFISASEPDARPENEGS